jgi:electron transfer flavoprotein alpha subunit
MSILVILPVESELGSASQKLLNCAQQVGDSITVLAHGESCAADYVSSLEKVDKVDSVLYSAYSQEPMAFSRLLHELVTEYAFTAVLAADVHLSQATLPRLAALLDVGQVSNITKVVNATTFEHPIYAGNVIETVEVLDSILIATVRCSAFDIALPATESTSIDPKTVNAETSSSAEVEIIEHIVSDSTSLDVSSSKWVVGIGRGASEPSLYTSLSQFAESQGFAVGGTRAVVDSGLMPNDKQIGQTGKVIAPDIYLAFGISGAIQHLAGISQTKKIFAINSDADAPILNVADVAYTGKLEDVIPELEALLAK